jgi:hypothetical protein
LHTAPSDKAHLVEGWIEVSAIGRKERVILDQSPLLNRRHDACQQLVVSLKDLRIY